MYINKLHKKIKTLRQRTWRNPAPRRPRKGKAKPPIEIISIKIEVESNHVPIEKKPIKEPKIKAYEKRISIQQKEMFKKGEVKHKE